MRTLLFMLPAALLFSAAVFLRIVFPECSFALFAAGGVYAATVPVRARVRRVDISYNKTVTADVLVIYAFFVLLSLSPELLVEFGAAGIGCALLYGAVLAFFSVDVALLLAGLRGESSARTVAYSSRPSLLLFGACAAALLISIIYHAVVAGAGIFFIAVTALLLLVLCAVLLPGKGHVSEIVARELRMGIFFDVFFVGVFIYRQYAGSMFPGVIPADTLVLFSALVLADVIRWVSEKSARIF